MRYRELEADFVSSYGDPVLQTPYRNLELPASNLYIREVYRLFRPILQGACNCTVVGSIKSGPKYVYTVCRYDREDTNWSVSFCQTTLECKCSCMPYV